MTDTAARERFVVDKDTLFLLGNGPSLADIDLRELSPHSTLGMNAAYRYWREIGWRPRFYACLDVVVGMSHREAIAELIGETGDQAIEQFILRDNLVTALGPVARGARVVNFDALRLCEPILRPDPVTTGSHAALWAATAGFHKIVLLGVDGDYVERVKGARPLGGIELEIVEERDNPNYFFAGYQKKGDRFNIPNPRPGLHLDAWNKAAALLRREGVRVVNGNLQSSVRFFPFVDARALIADGAAAPGMTGTAEPTAGLEIASAPRSLRERMDNFLRRQRGPLIGGLTVFLASAAAIAWFQSDESGDPSAYILLALAAGLFLALLFVRNTVSLHVTMLEQRIAALEAAAADDRRVRGMPTARKAAEH